MARNWVERPELRNSEFANLYFESPHKQITEDFRATVVKVHDGDTITLRMDERNFDFPLRFLNTNAPELNERGGDNSRRWLAQQILNEDVDVLIDKENRVDKWGRLLGDVMHMGLSMNEASIRAGKATPFNQRDEGDIPPLEKTIKEF